MKGRCFVMKVPKARRMSSGNWYINLRLGGESINVTESTEKKCIKAAQLIKAEYLAGRRVAKLEEDLKTLGDLIDDYINSRANVLSPSTIRGYKIIRNTRFSDVMDHPVQSVSDWQRVINAEASTCSAKTLHNAWMLVSAVLHDYTGSRPKVTLPQVVRNEHPYLTPDQIDTFVAAIRGDPIEVAALLGLCSLRCSEILGLRWKNVDLEKGILYVRGSAVRNADGKLVYKDTNKNRASNRVVPMMPQLIAALRLEGNHAPDDFVVQRSQQSIYVRVNTICRHNGLPEIGVHGLRHSFASLAYHLQIPYKVAMDIGGWSDDATMQQIYTHIAASDVLTGSESLVNFYSKSKNAN